MLPRRNMAVVAIFVENFHYYHHIVQCFLPTIEHPQNFLHKSYLHNKIENIIHYIYNVYLHNTCKAHLKNNLIP